jgi:hypothetical protein
MMRDWAKTQERFLGFDLSHQLGHIASTLGRIKSQIHLEISSDGVLATIQEARYFVEWATPNFEAETRTELTELKQVLEGWGEGLVALNSSSSDRMAIAEQAQEWSGRILDRSGLLSEQDYPFSVA